MRDAWRARLSAMSLESPHDPGGPALILSAHPDDEVLAIGAWLAGQCNRELVFVTATDGEASHPGSPTITDQQLRARRPVELIEALHRLGIAEPQVIRLGLPDGDLTAYRAELAVLLAPFVQTADLVLAPFERDGHPDHDVLGAVALELCASTTLWRFPIWTWAWTAPGGQDWLSSLRRLPCTSVGRHRKKQAMAAFVTQVSALSDHPADAAVVDGVLLRHATYAPEAVIA